MSDKWISVECKGAGTEEVYYVYRHEPCGTEIMVLQGHVPTVCPKCQPKEWAEKLPKRDIGTA